MKAKQIIFTVLTILFICCEVQAQDKIQYKTWKSFNNDTLLYIGHNFHTLGTQYAGKTVADVIKNIELPIIRVSAVSFMTIKEKDDEKSKPSTVVAVYIIVADDGGYVAINFAEPIDSNEYSEAITDTNGSKSKKMTLKLYDFLKDRKVHSVEVSTQFKKLKK